MAWEWVAPSATALLGLGGLAATWKTAKDARDEQGRQQTEALAAQRAAWVRDQRRSAYGDLAGEAREFQALLAFKSASEPHHEVILERSWAAVVKLAADRGDPRSEQELRGDAQIARQVEEGIRDYHPGFGKGLLVPTDAMSRYARLLRCIAHCRLLGGEAVGEALDRFNTALGAAVGPLYVFRLPSDEVETEYRAACKSLYRAMRDEIEAA